MHEYIGVDPSTLGRYYWSSVRFGAGGQVGEVRVGSRGSIHAALVTRVAQVVETSVGVEVPQQLYRGGAVARAVLGTAVGAGALVARFAADGCYTNVVAVAPEEWRLHVCGKRNPSDKQVKAALEARLGALPRCNVHVRDALGVALWLKEVGRSESFAWLRWESGSGWSSALPATAGSTRPLKARKSGSAKR